LHCANGSPCGPEKTSKGSTDSVVQLFAFVLLLGSGHQLLQQGQILRAHLLGVRGCIPADLLGGARQDIGMRAVSELGAAMDVRSIPLLLAAGMD